MDGMFEIHFRMDIFNDYSWLCTVILRVGEAYVRGYIENRLRNMVNIFAKLLDKQMYTHFFMLKTNNGLLFACYDLSMSTW